MPEELILYITKYGYLTIFGLVFLQEIGIPNPVPNEIILLFSGYLASVHRFDIGILLAVVIIADFVGTALLYILFYHFGERLTDKLPKWIPLRKERIHRLSNLITKRGRWGIYLGRLLPYVRGYTSVAAGLLRIPPRVYLLAVLFSAITWSGGYVIAGRILGSRWGTLAEKFGDINIIVITIVILVGVFYLCPLFMRRVRRNHNHTSTNTHE